MILAICILISMVVGLMALLWLSYRERQHWQDRYRHACERIHELTE